MNASPRYNHFAVHELYATACHDAGVCVRLLKLFLSSTPATMQQLERALRDGDRAEWRNASHTLKGSAMLIGARRLGRLAADVERAGRPGASDGALEAAGAANALRDEYAHVMREVADCAAGGATHFQQIQPAGAAD